MKKKKTDWDKLKQMNESEIEQNAIEDSDSYVATREELKQFNNSNKISGS
jgi:hypothetical protein